MDQNASRALIQAGQAVLGIEFGSTRIKAVLVGRTRPHLGRGHTRLGKPAGKRHLDL